MARYNKQPAGTQRSYSILVRFRPSVKGVIEEKLAWLRGQKGHEEATISELVRIAVWEYCKDHDDPRTP